MRKPRFKDWKEGEVRVKCEVVCHDGSKIVGYLPHLSEKAAKAWIGMIVDAARGGDVGTMKAALRAYKQWQKEQQKGKKKS